MGPLQINYREGIVKEIRHSKTMEESYSGKKHHVTVGLHIYPQEGKGGAFDEFRIENSQGETSLEKSVPREFLKAAEEGLRAGCRNGPFLGFPVHDSVIFLTELKASWGCNPALISACASNSLAEGFSEAGSRLLEPMAAVEIQFDAEFGHKVMADLTGKRRAVIEKFEENLAEKTRIIWAVVPLAELMGYASELRSLTSGTGTFHMELRGYQPVVAEVQRKIVAQVTGFF